MGTGKKRGLIAGLVAAAVALLALSVWASEPRIVGGRDTFRPNRTQFFWDSGNDKTSSKDFKNVGLGETVIKHTGSMVVTYTVKVGGKGPVEFRIPENDFKPGSAIVDPSNAPRADTFSFSAVLPENGWTCSDPRLKWRSPTGAPVTLRFVSVVVNYKVAKEEPDFGCR